MVPPFLSFLFLLPVCVMAQQHAADLTPLPPGMDELGTGAAGGISEAFDEAITGRGDLMLIRQSDRDRERKESRER